MNWYLQYKTSSSNVSNGAEIHPFDYDTWDEYQEERGMEPLETEQVMTDAERAFSNSKINLDRSKEIKRVIIDGKTIGAIATGWHTYNDNEYAEFAFDMAIQPEYRGNVNLLIRMIREAISIFEEERQAYHDMEIDTRMVVWVVNKKLVNVLQRYGFEIESDHGDGTAHMVYTK